MTDCTGTGHNPIPGTIEYGYMGIAIVPEFGRCAWCHKLLPLTVYGTLENHRSQTMRDVIDAYKRGYRSSDE